VEDGKGITEDLGEAFMEPDIIDTQPSMADQIYALRNLPTHLREAQMWYDLCDTLMDFDFLQAKIGASWVRTQQPIQPASVFDLLHDFRNALTAMPTDYPIQGQVAALYDALDKDSHILKEDPSLLVQQMHNTLVWKTGRGWDKGYARRHNATSGLSGSRD
jgi:hypothetical protein